MTQFTPISATIGGMLIGLSAVILMLAGGRVAGISGIVGGLLGRGGGIAGWRAAFVVGLIAAPIVYGAVGARLPPVQFEASLLTTLAGGALVGFGTQLGSGCTSGHGVCGLSLLSIRSLAATMTFMLGGIATVFVMRHVLGG